MDDTSLIPAYRKHPHNQYLSIGIAFGLLGLLWFVFALLYPLHANRGQLRYIALVFLVIVLLSMITEDTLETQAGVSFVTFFYCLLFLSSSLNGRLK
jgi:O-antigen ligase